MHLRDSLVLLTKLLKNYPCYHKITFLYLYDKNNYKLE